MERKIDNVELRKLIEPEIARLNDWSIGFVLPSVENKVIDASLGGSGTLVKIDEIQGILTANHVATAIFPFSGTTLKPRSINTLEFKVIRS
jgi:hypothetical protein